MTIRKFLFRGLLVVGILVAAVVLFFAGDHDDPDQDGPKPTLSVHHPHDYVRANARSSAFNCSMWVIGRP
jgi:hypothetical protein